MYINYHMNIVYILYTYSTFSIFHLIFHISISIHYYWLVSVVLQYNTGISIQ